MIALPLGIRNLNAHEQSPLRISADSTLPSGRTPSGTAVGQLMALTLFEPEWQKVLARPTNQQGAENGERVGHVARWFLHELVVKWDIQFR